MTVILAGVMAIAVVAVFLWAARREVSRWLKDQIADSLRGSREELLTLAQSRLDTERQKGLSDLESKRQAVEHAVQGLEKQLAKYEGLMQTFEQDRATKFGRLENELSQVRSETDKLRQTTTNLAAVLGNSRVRGQWGQKMAEDILNLCGLQEGVHYRQEKDIGGGRPDYLFRLPDDHQLFMDVKFPLENYLKYAQAGNPDDAARYRDAFIKDVSGHLREMERRDYVGQADRTVDYMLIFIPNEQVYGLVNEWMPGLIDESLRKKMIVCGPWTLYAVVRVIWQAWQNYHFSVAIQDIVKTINGFMQDYKVFKTRFGEVGDQLHKVLAKYQDVAATSYKRLDGKIQQIEEYRKGQRISEALPAADVFEELLPTKE